MYTIWEIETQNLWFVQMPSQGEMGGRKIFAFLSHIVFLWNNLWSVSCYIMGSFSGWWRLCGNDQQCLAAPIWKYRSGFGDHRFTFFIDLLPNYTFYTNLTNIVHWVVTYRDVAHLITLNWGKVEKKYAKSFDAGLSTNNNGAVETDESYQLVWSICRINSRPMSFFPLRDERLFARLPGASMPWDLGEELFNCTATTPLREEF